MQTRIVVLGDAWDLLKFLNDDEFTLDEKAAAKELRADAAPVLDAALIALEDVGEWTTAKIEIALKVALLENLALKPRRRSDRSGWPPPAHRSARRCSSRWNCSAATAACVGCAPGRDRARRPLPPRREKAPRIFGSLHVGPDTTGGENSPPRVARPKWPVTCGYRQPMGYGVIGNTADSGSAILGSSPGTPAFSRRGRRAHRAAGTARALAQRGAEWLWRCGRRRHADRLVAVGPPSPAGARSAEQSRRLLVRPARAWAPARPSNESAIAVDRRCRGRARGPRAVAGAQSRRRHAVRR